MRENQIVSLLLLIQVCVARITFLTNYSMVNSTGGPAYALDYDSTADFIITTIQKDPIGSQMLILTPNMSTSPPTFTTNFTPAFNAFRYRFRTKHSYTTSTFSNSPNYTQFNRTCHMIYKNYTQIRFTTMPFDTYAREFTFIQNNTVLNTLYVYDNYMSSKTQVRVQGFNASIYYTLLLEWNTMDTFIKGLQKNGLYFMLFADGLCVIRIDATLAEVYRVQWQLSSTQGIDIYGELVLCCYDFNVSIYDISANFTRVFTMTLKYPIFSCKFFKQTSILILTSTGIYQYNINTSLLETALAAQFPFSGTTSMDIMWGRYLVLYSRNPQVYSYLLFYFLDDFVDGLEGSSVGVGEVSVGVIEGVGSEGEASEFGFLKFNEQQSKKISQTAGAAMRVSTVQAVSKSVTMLVMIIDDLQYYQYHKVNYSYPIQFMILNANSLNSVRFEAWFLKGSGVDERIQQMWASQEALYSNFFPEDDKNPSSFYFLNAARSAYVENFLMCVFFFLCMKVVYLLFHFLRNKHIVCEAIRKWFRLNTTWWMLPAAFLENNMASLTFCCFVQLQGMMVSCFNFGNKANLCMAVLTLFCLIFYSFCFYLIIYAFTRKRVAKTLLSESECMASGFFWKSFSRTTRNFIRSFFHGFFAFNYKMQIVGLAWSNVLYIIATVACRKSFSNIVVFFFFVLYYLAFFAFDLSLALDYLFPNLFRSMNFEMFSLAIMGTLFAIFLALIIFSLLKFVLEITTKYLNKTIKKYSRSKPTPSKRIDKDVPKQTIIFIPVIKLTNPCIKTQTDKCERSVKNDKSEKSYVNSIKTDSYAKKKNQLAIKKQRLAQNFLDKQSVKQQIIVPKEQILKQSKSKTEPILTTKIHPPKKTHRHQPPQPRNHHNQNYNSNQKNQKKATKNDFNSFL